MLRSPKALWLTIVLTIASLETTITGCGMRPPQSNAQSRPDALTTGQSPQPIASGIGGGAVHHRAQPYPDNAQSSLSGFRFTDSNAPALLSRPVPGLRTERVWKTTFSKSSIAREERHLRTVGPNRVVYEVDSTITGHYAIPGPFGATFCASGRRVSLIDAETGAPLITAVKCKKREGTPQH